MCLWFWNKCITISSIRYGRRSDHQRSIISMVIGSWTWSIFKSWGHWICESWLPTPKGRRGQLPSMHTGFLCFLINTKRGERGQVMYTHGAHETDFKEISDYPRLWSGRFVETGNRTQWTIRGKKLKSVLKSSFLRCSVAALQVAAEAGG